MTSSDSRIFDLGAKDTRCEALGYNHFGAILLPHRSPLAVVIYTARDGLRKFLTVKLTGMFVTNATIDVNAQSRLIWSGEFVCSRAILVLRL